MADLYSTHDGVVILAATCFAHAQTPLALRDDVYQGAGMLMAYSPNCPHCIDKVPCIKQLAHSFAPEQLCVYVLNIDQDPELADMLQIQGVPSFFQVDAQGQCRLLT